MISPDWQGETVFIVAGGKSVASQNTDLLKGRRVIVVNSSWERCPFADILFFGDDRWWREYSKEVLAGFPGMIITCAPEPRHPRLIKLTRAVHTAHLAAERDAVMVRRTSTTGALNVAMHKGVATIVLLGLDGGHVHHHAEYGGSLSGSADLQEQHRDLLRAQITLSERGIQVFNSSPITALHDVWPHAPFEAYL